MQNYDSDQFKVVIIVSDGENHQGEAINLAEQARDLGIIIHTMGIESRKIAEKEYSIYKVIRDHLSIYDLILKHD